MNAQPRISPTELARAERLLMRWPRAIRLIRIVQLGRLQQQRAAAQARGALMARIREALRHADLPTLRAVLRELQQAA